jgi:hypothetical protein
MALGPLVVATAVALAWSRPACGAETRTYAIAIGNNSGPAGAGEASASLRYADDDAAAFAAFARSLSARTELLTTFDADSQQRFPELVHAARTPTLAELRHVIAEIRGDMLADLAAGRRPVLLFFYSGHGVQDAEGKRAALTLLDEGITQQRLYDEVLAALPAAAIHLLIDACYAEEVVRPRDLRLKVVDASDAEIEHLLARTTLARFPHVGAIVAASVNGQTHEWDFYRQGIFTHELLSGLRGAADVNGDGTVEYSELSAFLAAANREVPDARARLHVIARAPTVDPRLPLVELARLTRCVRFRLSSHTPRYFFVEDSHGNRLVEMRAEEGYRYDLYLPADEPLYYVSNEKTIEFRGRPGETLVADQLTMARAELRARGAIAAALHHGLFAASFGPSYYRGFVDSAIELVSVDFGRTDAVVVRGTGAAQAPAERRRLLDAWTVGGLSATVALAVTSATFAVLANDARKEYATTRIERDATEVKERFTRDRTIAIASGVAAAVAAGVGGGVILWRRLSWRKSSVELGASVLGPGAGVEVRW